MNGKKPMKLRQEYKQIQAILYDVEEKLEYMTTEDYKLNALPYDIQKDLEELKFLMVFLRKELKNE